MKPLQCTCYLPLTATLSQLVCNFILQLYGNFEDSMLICRGKRARKILIQYIFLNALYKNQFLHEGKWNMYVYCTEKFKISKSFPLANSIFWQIFQFISPLTVNTTMSIHDHQRNYIQASVPKWNLLTSGQQISFLTKLHFYIFPCLIFASQYNNERKRSLCLL